MAKSYWMFYLFYGLFLATCFISFTEGLSCPLIFEHAREECGYPGITEGDCETEGCCWDEHAQNTFARCYHRACKPGFFGWGCRFECRCQKGEICDSSTGQCPSGCSTEHWGIGCLLENSCTYNDPHGANYMGKKIRTVNGHICGSWSLQKAYPASHFADNSITLAKNYCRNPKPADYRTWCYYAFARSRKWDYCDHRQCNCMTGRFGVNCEKECHCRDPQEVCHSINGTCPSGCDPNFQGHNCQECADGRFGVFCEHACQCRDPEEVCDKRSGYCRSGCAPGRTGQDCQTECADGMWGLNCQYPCNCMNRSELCDRGDGTCLSGCRTGYSGAGCQIKIPLLKSAPRKESRNSQSVSLRWKRWRKPVDGGDGPVEGYLVYYKGEDDTEWSSVRSEGTRYAVKNLQANTLYTFKVSPIHKEGFEGFASPELKVPTCGKPLVGPQDLKVKQTGGTTGSVKEENGMETPHNSLTQLSVHWKAPSMSEWNCDRLYRYKVYARPGGKEEFEYLQEVEIHRVVIPDVDIYQNFTVGVTVINNAGFESDMTTVTYIGKPGSVENLQATAVSATSLKVMWDNPKQMTMSIESFVIRFKEMRIADCDVEHSSWSDKVMIPGHKREYVMSSLRPYTRYQIRLWAETTAGKGQLKTITGTTFGKVPETSLRHVTRTMLKPHLVSFTWDPVECEQRLGDTVGYVYEIKHYNRDRDNAIKISDMVNETRVTIDDLIPYTKYIFQVQFVNNIGAGPFGDPQEFTTLQGRPPAPHDVQVVVSTSEALSVAWETPDPPHGYITGYEVQYWSPYNLGHPEVVRVGPEQHRYNITGLVATTEYGIQVRAYTPVGSGTWSPQLFGYTAEAYPDPPSSFTNITRSKNTITFQWTDPKKANGILQAYRILCSVVSKLTGSNARDVEMELPANIHNFTLKNLNPGTEYVCSLRASTKKGYGDSIRRIFWTFPKDPEPPSEPEIDSSLSTATTLAVKLPMQLQMNSKQLTKKIYQVVVEMLPPQMSHPNKRSITATPCGLPYDMLLSYHIAMEEGLSCYVAAELTTISDNHFVVGDNKTYGSYFNAPLEEGKAYDVWLGMVTVVDGVTAASYSKTASPGVASHYLPPEETRSGTIMIAGTGVAVLIAIILVIIIVAVVISRRRASKREAKLISPPKTPSDEGAETPEKPTRPPRRFELEEQSNTHKYIDISKAIPLPDINSDEELSDRSECDTLFPSGQGNPGVDGKAKPISVENLWNYIKEKKASKSDTFKQEYESLHHGLKMKCEIARKPENKLKNRYGNIVAYDHSRVTLQCFPDDPHSDYINADYIDAYRKPKSFIATQGPTKYTLNDIWRLAWEQNSHRIVMVTNLVEDGRHKCEQYWPEHGSKMYGDIRVDIKDMEQLADFTIRTFDIVKDHEARCVQQFHFTAWPDHGVPSYATSLLGFRKKVRSFDDPTKGATIVHCSAGVGRTGTFIAIDYLLEQARVEGQVDIYGVVTAMRANRVNMIQTLEQYIFVHDALLEALKCGDTSIACVDFRRRYSELLKHNPETGKQRLHEEFLLLGQMSPSIDRKPCRDAVDPENTMKNRTRDVLPVDNLARPYLVTYIPGATDYINAIFCDGYRQKDAFIVTQMPLPATVMDFWTMVYDHEVKTTVMMNQLIPHDDTCVPYWPEDVGCSLQCGPFNVDLLSLDTSQKDVVVRDFAVTFNKKSNDPHYVRQFQYLGWPQENPVPPYKSSMLRLLGMVEKWQQRSGNGIIAVHCMNGADQSGLYCAVSYMLERLKLEQEVDVFQSTKHVRINRPQLVPSKIQYQFLYEIAIEYMDSFDAYANFK